MTSRHPSRCTQIACLAQHQHIGQAAAWLKEFVLLHGAAPFVRVHQVHKGLLSSKGQLRNQCTASMTHAMCCGCLTLLHSSGTCLVSKETTHAHHTEKERRSSVSARCMARSSRCDSNSAAAHILQALSTLRSQRICVHTPPCCDSMVLTCARHLPYQLNSLRPPSTGVKPPPTCCCKLAALPVVLNAGSASDC